MRLHQTRRRGMTLIELMVAAALSLVIMAVLASAFQTGMDTLSQLKSIGDLQHQLRSSSEKIKADLAAPHFDDPAVANGKLSEVRFDQNPSDFPSSGMFRIVQLGASYQEVGATTNPKDYSTVASPSGKPSHLFPVSIVNLLSRPNGNANAMQFAMKLDGKTRQKVFTGPRLPTAPGAAFDNKFDNLVQDPTTTYATRWAVISYFLVDSGTKTADGSPLYNLHRRVQLLAEQSGVELANPNANYSIRTGSPGHFPINTVADLLSVANRPGSTTVPGLQTDPAFNAFLSMADGSDVVMSNVVSFEIKANWEGNYRKMTPTQPTVPAQLSGPTGDVPNPDYPFDDIPPWNQAALSATSGSSQFETAPRIFDTTPDASSWEQQLGVTAVTPHTRVRINAIQIKLRVWDPKNRGARQMTLVQDM
ncbi:MAG TPA: prepilin-type N-terminal cleavage/methylation domain-containing protein [Fimbriiglobus sp.]|jgi:prepilin-type N-terminal cleavage/methylation domain-containing protein